MSRQEGFGATLRLCLATGLGRMRKELYRPPSLVLISDGDPPAFRILDVKRLQRAKRWASLGHGVEIESMTFCFEHLRCNPAVTPAKPLSLQGKRNLLVALRISDEGGNSKYGKRKREGQTSIPSPVGNAPYPWTGCGRPRSERRMPAQFNMPAARPCSFSCSLASNDHGTPTP